VALRRWCGPDGGGGGVASGRTQRRSDHVA
jgi:hypothetical protein